MNRIAFLFLLCVASALLAWAFSNNGKEAAPVFLLGAALLLCTLAVGGIRLVTGNRSPATNKSAIGGATIGLFSGAVVGAKSGFGRVMISIFNV